MIPRLIIASLLLTALVGVPGASAAVQDDPRCYSTEPTVQEICDGDFVDNPCDEDIDCDDPCSGCPTPQEIYDMVCPGGLSRECGIENPCEGNIDCNYNPCDEDVDCTPCNPSSECPDPTPCWQTGECEHPVDELERILQEVYDQYGRPVLCLVLEREPSYLGYCDTYGNPRIQPDTQRIRDDANAAANEAVTLAVTLANYAVGLVPTQEEVEQAVDENAPDTDGDGTPDVVEQATCGSALVRNNLNASGYVYCASAADLYVEPTGTFTDEVNATRDAAVAFAEALVAWALAEVDDLVSQVDADRDNVPDEAEPWICQVENANFDEDGSCDETLTDYSPPAA